MDCSTLESFGTRSAAFGRVPNQSDALAAIPTRSERLQRVPRHSDVFETIFTRRRRARAPERLLRLQPPMRFGRVGQREDGRDDEAKCATLAELRFPWERWRPAGMSGAIGGTPAISCLCNKAGPSAQCLECRRD